MNSNVADTVLTTGKEKGKKHQAYNMELTRLEQALEMCADPNNCSEYNSLGGASRHQEIKSVVEVPLKADASRRKVQKDTNPNNMYQKEKSPTEVRVADVSGKADHSGGVKNKILSNSQALSEEISKIRYLIEHMNNNNDKQII